MRIQLAKGRQRDGNLLFVTLFLILLAGAFVVYYLNLVRAQNNFVARSQAWNASLAVAEAGVEEALAQLNPAAAVPYVNRAANGWGGPSAGGIYGPVSRSLASSSYSVYVTGDTNPIIYSTGYTTNLALGALVQRTVRVTTKMTALFTVALGAKRGVDFSGNGTATDSFDSSLTNLSWNGLYYQPWDSTNGDVASIAGIVNVANGDINGKVQLGPTATNSISSNGIITGGVDNDFNVDFWDVLLPQANWLEAVPNVTTIDGVPYNYVFDTPGSYTNKISGNFSGNIYVGTNTQLTLLMTGGSANLSTVRVDGGPGPGGQLTLYADGPTMSLVTVTNYYATNFVYLGTTNNTQVNFNGNATFTGVLYAPEALIKMSGGGNSIVNFIGSIIGDTVKINGHFQFHFDESLLRTFMRGYVANSWQEL